jgi:hypothetical protein
MPVTRWNKTRARQNSDAYNDAADCQAEQDSLLVTIPVVSQAERDALAAAAPGGVLPTGAVVRRTDQLGDCIDYWDGAAWQSHWSTTIAPANGGDFGWTVTGTILRTKVGALTQCTLSARATRNVSSFTLNTTVSSYVTGLVPAGYTPNSQTDILTSLMSSGGAVVAHINAFIFTNGNLYMSVDASTAPWAVGSYVTLQSSWWI